MKTFRRGQLWLVNFEPSIGHEYRKIRPAVIIQQEQYIEGTSLVTVLPVSSQTSKCSILDISVSPDAANRLLKESLIKTKQISSFDRRRFIKFIGVLSSEIMLDVDVSLGLFRISHCVCQDCKR